MDAETTTEVLRAAIEAAVRRRDPGAGVYAYPPHIHRSTWRIATIVCGVPMESEHADYGLALCALATAVGLRPDGSDSAEEVRQLRERVDILSARHEAGLEDRERLRNERDEARAEIERLRTDNARLDNVARGALDDLARVRGEFDAARAALDRAHHAVREHGPRCSHPECDALAPLRCDDCGRRFCDEHDDGLAGHDPGFGPQAHAVGPDDLMAGAAMRAAEASR